MSNDALAQAAVNAVTDKQLDAGNPNYPNDPGVERKGMCSRFVRCTCRKVYHQKYQDLFGGTAIDSGKNFAEAGLATASSDRANLESGDILFVMRGSGGFGHVGIYLGDSDGRVAENSSAHPTGPNGAKGYRRLSAFPEFQLIGRLPAPDVIPPQYTLFLSGREITQMPVKDGHAYCAVRTWGRALGFDVDWDDQVPHIYFNGDPVGADDEIWLRDEQAYLPIRTLAAKAGLQVEFAEDTHRVLVFR